MVSRVPPPRSRVGKGRRLRQAMKRFIGLDAHARANAEFVRRERPMRLPGSTSRLTASTFVLRYRRVRGSLGGDTRPGGGCVTTWCLVVADEEGDGGSEGDA